MTCVAVDWAYASPDPTRRVRRAQAASALHRRTSRWEFTLLALITPVRHGLGTLQRALRHRHYVVPSN